MKKLHIILAILNIVSIILLVQIVFGWIPSFECDYPLDKIDKINSLIVDLSIGVITSTLFYILLVVIPEKRKSHTTRQVLSINLRYLAENMQYTIAHIAKIYSLKIQQWDLNYSHINLQEFSKIKSSLFSKDYISGSYEIFLRKDNNEHSIGISQIDLKDICSKTMNLTDKTLSSPSIIFEDENLIKLLHAINICDFHKLLIVSTTSNTRIPINNTIVNKLITEYYMLYLSLLKYTSTNNFRFETREKSSATTGSLSDLVDNVKKNNNKANVSKKLKPKRKKQHR